jgi:hypothetical protein
MYTFETQIYALGVYWQAEVTYTLDETIDVTDVWLLGCYPEGCESARAVDRNDYDPYRVRADIGYFSDAEYQEILRRCELDFAKQRAIAEEAMYE